MTLNVLFLKCVKNHKSARMGCDGGTIPRRDELVKMKKKPETKDKEAQLLFEWRYCALSQEVLKAPIVTCGLGRLYNKSAVIEGLLNRTSLPLSAKHIRSLKDIKDLNLTLNPSYDDKNIENFEGINKTSTTPFVCPITGLEMSGKFRFICFWTCGCVVSERALKQIDMKMCHNCQKPFTTSDIITLNGNEDDLKAMITNMKCRQALEKSQKVKRKVEEIPKDNTSEIKVKKLEIKKKRNVYLCFT